MPLKISRIPWRLKSVAFRTLSSMPPSAYRWCSMHITGRAIRDFSNQGYFHALNAHLAAFARVPNANDSVLFEFGAGTDLLSSLYFSSKGIERQIVVDLQRNVRVDALNSVLERAGFMEHRRPFTEELEDELQELGIAYLAPYDVRECKLVDRSVSLICTTETLEHIPASDLVRVLSECRRIIKTDGLMSMWIDYSDHYCHTDPAIGPYNFLQFSTKAWTRHNSRLQFQNRLRHCHYRSLFLNGGFEVVDENRLHPIGWRDTLNRVRINDEFSDCSPEDLGATCGHFVLRPDGRAAQ